MYKSPKTNLSNREERRRSSGGKVAVLQDDGDSLTDEFKGFSENKISILDQESTAEGVRYKVIVTHSATRVMTS